MSRFTSFLWLQLARWFEAKGMVSQSETLFRYAAEGEGKSASDAAFRLGKQQLDQEKNHHAAVSLETAVRLDPRHARAWCALGAARRKLAQLEESKKATERALALNSDYAQARCNLGEWHMVKADASTALTHFDQALVSQPDLLEALNNRVAALYELGRFTEAEEAARLGIEHHPGVAALHVNLGNVLLHSGKARPAVKAYRRALECDPACPEALLNLSTLLGETHHLAEVLSFIEHEIAAKGESAQRLAALALAQHTKGDTFAAEATCHKVIELQPGNVSALVTLAGCLSAKGDHRSAIAAQERALASNPNMPAIQSNLAFNATYLPELSVGEVFEFHRQWAHRFEKPVAEKRYVHPFNGDPGKRLRIAYVSGDFGMHPVGFLIRDVLRHHHREHLEIHCFSMMRKDDEITVEIRAQADVWHDVLLDSDNEVAKRINEAGIDIAVDLSGHTAYNRLAALALKPASVQVAWIGYFHSTGLDTIDYFITDPITSPPETGQLFSETPVYLPHTRFCYAPPAYAPLPEPPPCIENGYVTFGCFNRLDKLVDEVILAWSRILQALPYARLLLKASSLDNETMVEELCRRFAANGIGSEHIELRGRSGHAEMLAEYGDIDIALDPFPFNGGMTTLEALWMGVPVVTFAGNTVVSRQTVSALANIGLADELAFPDIDAYINGAIALANNPARLAELRSQLRPRMEASPLRQSEQFTRDLEGLYRRMWQAWCRGEKLKAYS